MEDVPVSLALGHAIKDTVDKDTIVILSEAENDMCKNKLANSRSTKSAVLNALQKTLEAKVSKQKNILITYRQLLFKSGRSWSFQKLN